MNSHFRSRILALAWSLGIAVLGVVVCLMWLGQDVAAMSSATSAAPAPVAARLYLRAPSVYTYPLTSTLDICETYGPRVLTTSVSSSYDFDLGVDWCAPENIPVHAVTTGTVQSFSGDCAVGTAGCFVQLIHDAADGQTRYSHLASVHSAITDDLEVSPGQIIGWVGKESDASSAYLHFEVHDGLTVTQRAAIHPLDTPFVPWTNRVSPTIVLRGLYTDATGMTALVGVTSPYTEPDVITVSVAVDGAVTDSRLIDYVNLNANANGDETLDDPLVQDVCIIPASLNGTNGYSVTMAFRGLAYSSPATVSAQALDVDGWGSTTTVNLVGGLEIAPPEQAAESEPGQAATFVYTLTNRGGASDTFTLTHLSAQGWSAVVTPTTVILDDGNSVTVTVQVMIDADESGPPDCGLLVATGTQAGSQPVVAGFYRLHRVIPPNGAHVDGPTAGVINGAYTFTATVAPPTTTVPITYHWQATGQSDVWTTTSELSHTVSFNWDTSGAKTITVTAENAAGASTDTHVITITAVVFPFFDGFESGLLGEGWTVITTTEGRVQVSSTYPYSGTYSALLDDEVENDTNSFAALILNIDLEGQSGVMLDFWWREFYDEHVEENDGVYISDDYGNSWYPVLSFTGTVESFRHEAIYLDDVAAAGNRTFNDHFQIKFQSYGNYPIAPSEPGLSDGYALDNVWVRAISLDGVEISGPGLGNIDTLYTFSATASPSTATLPITYAWSPEPVAGQGSALVTYTWPVTGVKTITVTASNMSGVASDTHAITVNVPPGSVGIDGAALGNIDVSHAFTATVNPPTTTLPITYTWQAEGQSEVVTSASAVDHTAWFTWSTPGLKSITVTAANVGGIVTGTHVITINMPPDSVGIDGPALGNIDTPYTFTASVSPPTVTLPITYHWEASGQSGVVKLVDTRSHQISFTWGTSGTKVITVTATNVGGMVTNTHVITVNIPPSGVEASGPSTGLVNVSYVFTANVSPPTTTLPITYTWQATGLSQETHIVSDATDTMSFTWSTVGSQTVTVMATNIGGTVSNTHAVAIKAVDFPFFDGFESGDLGAGWATATTVHGRVQVSSTYPYSGTYSVLLDDADVPFSYSTAALILNIDLAGRVGVVLDFWWQEFEDDEQAPDGVFISDDDGQTWHQVLSFNGTHTGYQHEVIYLDAAATAGGMTFNDHFQIKFQFFDDQPIPADGYAIDDVWVRSEPVDSVEISGPGLGNIDTLYTFSATASPSTATLPITYVWSPEPVAGQGSTLVTYTWPVTGVKTITITASNMSGVASDTHTITVNVPPDSVGIDGAALGNIDVSHAFTATVSPPTTTLPITYTWQAEGQSEVVASASAVDHTAWFTWSTPGLKSITVTAANVGGIVTGTHVITVNVPPDSVGIDGAALGNIDTPYTFTASVSPPTVTLPITYHWEASGQGGVVTLVDARSHQISFTWGTSGTKVITVTATNVGGMVTDTHVITVNIPPSGVDIDGPTMGNINVPYTFTATVRPPTVTLPITYVWQAREQGEIVTSVNSIHHAISFTWRTAGPKVITVSVINIGGVVTQTHVVTVNVPPADVNITGRQKGVIQVDYSFMAQVVPVTTTVPITYIWEATGLSSQTHLYRGLMDTVSFNWDVTGTKTITVTAANVGGVISNTHVVTLGLSGVTGVAISGPITSVARVATPFTATVSPITATRPVTYIWEFTDRPTPVVHGDGGLIDTVAFTWHVTGTKTVTVTAINIRGIVSYTRVITILRPVPPESVTITGPMEGIVPFGYAFTATVSPVSTTVPITYFWSATDGMSQTHTGDREDTAIFGWDTPGTKTVTVTAMNPVGAVTQTHVFTTRISPLTGLAVEGPAWGHIQTGYTFTATATPFTASIPITYHWRATDQVDVLTSTNTVDHVVAFTWDEPGLKTITVTATNAGNSITRAHAIDVYIPPGGVTISGPSTGHIDTLYAFTADVSPPTATLPITYHWRATDQLDVVTSTGTVDHLVSFTWDEPGTKGITVTATNAGGSVTATHIIAVYVPPAEVVVDGPTTGHIDKPYTFTANVSPPTATLPITYHWRATGQVEVVTSTGSADHAVPFTWRDPGTKAITVTATNAGGSVTATHTVIVSIPPSGVTIEGGRVGIVNAPYTFTATVSPPTATLPITYHWRATDQLDIITPMASAGHAVAFTWSDAGAKAITITATSAGASVTATHAIIVNILPSSVDISGPVVGGADAVQTFVAAVSPGSATVPITYSWQAAGQMPVTHTGGTSNAAAFTWSAIGVQTVTVTATNVVGTVSDSHAIAVVDGIPFTVYPEAGGALTYTDTQGLPTILQAPAGAVTETITLVYKPLSSATTPVTPNLLFAGHAFSLRAYVGTRPLSSFVFSEPITITIHYSDDDVAGLTEETLNLYYREGSAWSRSGITLVTLDTVNNRLVARIAHLSQFAVFGFRVAPTGVIIDGPETGIINHSYTFTATVGPGSATTPITYHWWATGQGDLITTQSSLGHAVSFTWDAVGAKTIGVTVTNAGGTAAGTHVFGVEWYTAFLPMLVRNWPPAPYLYPIDNPGDTGSYDVCWRPIASFGNYELEEATDGGFTDVTNVYMTTDACYGISDKGPPRYYYRVRYCSGSGCSDWSNVEWVNVVWEKEPNSSSSKPVYAPANGPLVSDVDYRGLHNDRDDYFKVYLRTGEHIVVDLTTPFTMPTPDGLSSVWLLLYDLDLEQDLNSRKGAYSPPYHLDYTAQKTGWHYIRIFTPPDFWSEEPYTLQATYP